MTQIRMRQMDFQAYTQTVIREPSFVFQCSCSQHDKSLLFLPASKVGQAGQARQAGHPFIRLALGRPAQRHRHSEDHQGAKQDLCTSALNMRKSRQTQSQITWTALQYRIGSKKCSFVRPASHRTNPAKMNGAFSMKWTSIWVGRRRARAQKHLLAKSIS